MKLSLVAAAAVLVGLAMPALADDDVSCVDLLAQVNQTLDERSSDLTQETLETILNLRDQGAAACNAGNEEQADEYLEEAISKFQQ
jgi:hypothetical protein